MRTPFVAGNWKMNGSRASNAELIEDLIRGRDGSGKVEVAVCAPFVYLWEVAKLVKDSGIEVGSQDVSEEQAGAFTGEVSAAMLKDVGCRYAIVGHSERRTIYKETDALTARKFVAAQQEGLVPIFCVGELLEERERGETETVVARQLTAVLDVAGVAAFASAVVAYEPVWAIGTGKTASPEQAQEVHALIRRMVIDRDAKIGNSLRILYGGSVKASNAAELFGMPDVDGGLVGGASLKADEFVSICKAAG